MSRKNILRHEKMKPIKEKKNKKTGAVLKGVIGAVVVVGVVIGGAFLYKNFAPKLETEKDTEMFYTPPQSLETVSFKNSFIVSTIDGIKILSKKGEDINEDVANSVSPYIKGMKDPVFSSNDKSVLAFDIEGKTAVLFNEAGIIESYNFSGNIINGKMSDSGQFVFVVEDSGSKAAVKAYSADGQELMSWYSGKGYVADAAVNNEKSRMAVVTNEIINGEVSSKILLFSLDNSEPYMGKIIGNTLCSAVSFYGDNVFMVCEDGLYRVNKDSDIELCYGFTGRKMKHFKFFKNGNALLFSENPIGENYNVAVFNTKGRLVSEFTVDSFLNISDTENNKFLVIKRKGVISVNHRGKIKEEIPCEFEVKDAKYFKDKIAVVSQDKIFFE